MLKIKNRNTIMVMYYLGQFLLITEVVIAIILGITVFTQGGFSRKSIFFAISVLAGATWALYVALFLQEENVALFVDRVRLAYAAALVLVWAMAGLGVAFQPKKVKRFTGIVTLMLIPMLLTVGMMYIFPDTMFGEAARVAGANSVELVFGGLAVYAIVFAAYLGVATWLLVLAYRRTADLAEKKRIRSMILAYILSGPFGTVFGLVLPWFQDFALLWIAPLCGLLFMSSSYVAIVRHGMFEVKAIMIRVISYFITLLTVVVAYVLIFFLVFRFVFKVDEPGIEIFILNLIMSVVIMALFPVMQSISHLVRRLMYGGKAGLDGPYIFRRIYGMAMKKTSLLWIIRGLKRMFHVDAVWVVRLRGRKDIALYGTRRSDGDAVGVRELYSAADSMKGIGIMSVKDFREGKAREFLKGIGASKVVILRSGRGDLEGVLILGNTVGHSEMLAEDAGVLLQVSEVITSAVMAAEE
ncbi:hypothetical protein LJC07_06365 [Christensenellaceae bacterium OttesenSCG-928-L17]|nr:hypothetical protein [Christensenellaceae bacterium OttesenSCG-928-L17]